MKALQSLVKQLNEWADKSEAHRQGAKAKGQSLPDRPLVILDAYGEPEFSIDAFEVGRGIAKAFHDGAFDGEVFDELRPSLYAAERADSVVVCLARFLLQTYHLHLSGPVHADLRAISSALKSAKKEWLSDAARGRRVKAGAKAGHIAAHGSKSEKQKRCKKYRHQVTDIRKHNPHVSLTEARRQTAKKFGVSYRTVLTHTKNDGEKW